MRAVLAAALAAVVVLAHVVGAFAVSPPAAPERVPVLIVDGGLGDDRFFGTHWLGEPEVYAEDGGARLATSASPIWWEGGSSPDTYVLSASDGSGSPASRSITVPEIAWAIDKVVERHPAGKVVLIGQGATGLQVRRYVADLGNPTQSSRADVVGMVLLGVPNRGTELAEVYPDLDVWEPYAAGGGLTPEQILPESGVLAEIDAAPVPAVVKTLVVQGIASKLAGHDTDGVLTVRDSSLATESVVGSVDSVTVRARASESWPLRATWLPKSKKGGALLDAVDDAQVERLGPSSGYATAPDVREAVRMYYETWFSGPAPTTHIASRIVVDVSGSMLAKLGDGTTRIDAAKRAAADFVGAHEARGALASSVPEDIGLIVFDGDARTIAPAGSAADEVRSAVDELTIVPLALTNIGDGLTTALASFDESPKTADRVVVLLSDGMSTTGLGDQEVLEGPVKEAADRGIRIEVILLGDDVDAEGEQFLAQIAEATGGSYHSAQDQHELRRDFLRARFAGLGEMFVDAEVSIAAAEPVDLGTIDEGTRLFEFAVLADSSVPSWSLRNDGVEVASDAILVTATDDGLIICSVESPAPGRYELAFDDDGATRAHVFAARQVDTFKPTAVVAVQDDSEILFLAGLGALAALGIVFTVVASVRGRRGKSDAVDGSELFGRADGDKAGD